MESFPAIIEVEITGMTSDKESVTVNYADYYGGPAGINRDLVTLEPLYSFPRAAKRKIFLKPDRIVKVKNDHLRVLFVRGLWHQYSGVDAAIKQIEGAEVVDCWYGQSDVGVSLSDFPADYATALGYDVIVLANIDGPALGSTGQEMLTDFVEAGGGLLLISGDRTYGQATFDNARFIEALPVKLQGPSDWRKLAKPAVLRSGNSSISRAVKFDGKAAVLYRHILEPNEGAVVALRADEFPALVTSERGKGRIACALVLPFGNPEPPLIGYWDSEEWQEAMKNTVEWLAGR